MESLDFVFEIVHTVDFGFDWFRFVQQFQYASVYVSASFKSQNKVDVIPLLIWHKIVVK